MKQSSAKPKLKIRRIKNLDSAWLKQAMLSSEPWKTLNFTARDCRRIAKNSDSKIVFGAFQGVKLVGIASHSPGFLGGVYLGLLVVLPSHRGQGIGESLMQHCLKTLMTNHPNYYLCVSSFNKGALRFYKDLGFRKIGKIENFFHHGKHEIFMRKTLGPLR